MSQQTLLTLSGPGGTREVPLDARGLVMGRDPACGLPLDDPLVSRQHARLFQDPFGRWIIEDLGSRNGVWVGGRQIRAHALAPGEKMEVGSTVLWLSSDSQRQISADPRLGDHVTVDVDPTVTQVSAAPRGGGAAAAEALSESRFRQLNQITEALGEVAASDELYPAICRVLSDRPDAAAVVLRLPPVEKELPSAPAILSCGMSGREHPEGPVNLHLSRRVLESVRSASAAVMAGSFRGRREGEHLGLTLTDPNRPRAVCCAPIGDSGGEMDVLYVDLPSEAAAPDLLEFTQAVARHLAMARRSLLLAEERGDRKALDRQLAMAREIQSKLTPAAATTWPGAEVAVHYEPAMWVGGDYCDVWTLEDGRLAFAVGDVSGKGLPAALVMTNLQAALRTTLSFCRDLPEVMGRLSRHLETHLPDGMFVTMILGLLDCGSGELQCVNAGHLLPLIRGPEGDVSELGQPRNPPLGVPAGAYEVESLRLPAGAALVVVTDGITESQSPAGEEFGVAGLRLAVAGARANSPSPTRPGGADLLQAVTKAAGAFRQTLPQHDDVTVLAIVRK
jgi:serine phosphatase RsbU (regulator of sigma subunit)